MIRSLVLGGLLFGALAACSPATRLDPLPQGPYAPGQQVESLFNGAETEDGLIVGHRLMESGNYELAMKAYCARRPKRTRISFPHGTIWALF